MLHEYDWQVMGLVLPGARRRDERWPVSASYCVPVVCGGIQHIPEEVGKWLCLVTNLAQSLVTALLVTALLGCLFTPWLALPSLTSLGWSSLSRVYCLG